MLALCYYTNKKKLTVICAGNSGRTEMFMDSFTTMITPYNEDGSIDLKTAEKYVEWYYDSGLTGIFSVCLSSEIFALSLEERVKLNRIVYKKAKELEQQGKRKFTVVSSGHISDDFNQQVNELNEIYKSGTDALVLITNRLDINNEGDDVFIKNAEKLINRLPDNAKLGLYECPYPYKRLVTPKILSWCKQMGRFYYMKDTCCDDEMISNRCNILKDSGFKLLNANCQTLLSSMKNGAAGYCGIMANFHPKLYAWLCNNYENNQKAAELVQAFIAIFGFIETGLAYPLTAKYHMNLCGIKTNNIARNRDSKELTPYAKSCMKQMKMATDYIEQKIINL